MMKKLIFPLFVFFALTACNNEGSFKKAEDALDAAREFVRASLDGNYDKAQFYLYPDSTNIFLIDRWKKNYDQLSSDEKGKYKDADIIVLNVRTDNDSVTTYQYYNSYKKDTTTIKILRIKGEWLVDLKEFIKNQR
jgi:hypothetical protein